MVTIQKLCIPIIHNDTQTLWGQWQTDETQQNAGHWISYKKYKNKNHCHKQLHAFIAILLHKYGQRLDLNDIYYQCNEICKCVHCIHLSKVERAMIKHQPKSYTLICGFSVANFIKWHTFWLIYYLFRCFTLKRHRRCSIVDGYACMLFVSIRLCPIEGYRSERFSAIANQILWKLRRNLDD